jgi:hypothetical protein
MNGPNDTRSSTHPSRPGRAQITPGADAAVVAQSQRVVHVLEDAARACDARTELHNEPPEGPEFDRWISRCDGETVRSAADQMRFAAAASLPVSFPDHIVGPVGRSASPAWADVDTDPLPLLERAWEQLEFLPDDPTNLRLLEATFAVADALAAVRAHYE